MTTPNEEDADAQEAGRAVAEETAVGHTPLRVHWQYLTAGTSVLMVLFLLLGAIGIQALPVVASWMLAQWSRAMYHPTLSDQYAHRYVICMLIVIAGSVAHTILFYAMSIRAGRQLFRRMLSAVSSQP